MWWSLHEKYGSLLRYATRIDCILYMWCEQDSICKYVLMVPVRE
jgi:hypothetical protein